MGIQWQFSKISSMQGRLKGSSSNRHFLEPSSFESHQSLCDMPLSWRLDLTVYFERRRCERSASKGIIGEDRLRHSLGQIMFQRSICRSSILFLRAIFHIISSGFRRATFFNTCGMQFYSWNPFAYLVNNVFSFLSSASLTRCRICLH